jgi:maleate isomerase
VILPSVNTVVEPWFGHTVPQGITVHAARMFLSNDLSAAKIIEMDETEGMQAVRQIASCRPASIAYCCTASSVVQGQAYDARLREEITHRTGVPATTATHAILSALKLFGAKRICMASPYSDEVDAMEHRFFEAAGLEVIGAGNLNIRDSFRLAEPTPAVLRNLGRRTWKADADALVITCLNTRSHTVIDELEQEIGRPVVTSTQATLWHGLRLAGIERPIEGYGRLLREL